MEDVVEKQFVFVAKSAIPEAGEGLFAKKDIPENTVFAYFGGER